MLRAVQLLILSKRLHKVSEGLCVCMQVISVAMVKSLATWLPVLCSTCVLAAFLVACSDASVRLTLLPLPVAT